MEPEVDNDEYFRRLLPGYNFCPTDNELIVHYLMNKILNLPMPRHRFKTLNIYKYHPRDLANEYTRIRENGLYFFTSRDKRYPNGKRPARSAGGGCWKATGKDYDIYVDEIVVGSKMSLVYYEGGKIKTKWLMQEYTINQDIITPTTSGATPPTPQEASTSTNNNNNILDECVLVKIYYKGYNYPEYNMVEDDNLIEAQNDVNNYPVPPQQNHHMGEEQNDDDYNNPGPAQYNQQLIAAENDNNNYPEQPQQNHQMGEVLNDGNNYPGLSQYNPLSTLTENYYNNFLEQLQHDLLQMVEVQNNGNNYPELLHYNHIEAQNNGVSQVSNYQQIRNVAHHNNGNSVVYNVENHGNFRTVNDNELCANNNNNNNNNNDNSQYSDGTLEQICLGKAKPPSN